MLVPVWMMFCWSCAPRELAGPSESEVSEKLKGHVEESIQRQWKVQNLVTVEELKVTQTSPAGQLCHVRAEGVVLFRETLGPQNVMGFGGLQGQRKSFTSEMNFVRQNGAWKLRSVKFREN